MILGAGIAVLQKGLTLTRPKYEIHAQHRAGVVDQRAGHDPGISGHVRPESLVTLLRNTHAQKLIEFLQALIKDAGKKVFLILDNLRVHHSKLVKAWVNERKDKIELFYLPSYSPELNPEERLNADLKQEMGKRVPVRTKAKLRDAANEHMMKLEQNPERVMSYFQDSRVRYAA